MKIENSFEVGVGPAEAWPILTDVERVAPCLPGARVTGADGNGSFQGEMKVKLGPVSMTFVGEMSFVARDDAAFEATARARAREARNRGGADADISFRMYEVDSGSRVDVVTDLTLTGPAAQYGRGAGMVAAVSEELIAQFAECLRGQLAAAQAAPPTVAEAEPTATGPDTSPPAAPPASGLRLAWRAAWRSIKRLFGRA